MSLHLDTSREFVFDRDTCVAVVGFAGEYVFVQLDRSGQPIDRAALEAAYARGFAYCGCLGMHGNKPGARLSLGNPDAIFTAMAAGAAYAHWIVDQWRAQAGDARTRIN